MATMVRFGPWSTTLGLAALFGASVAVLLLLRPNNRVANRFLAALIVAAVLRLMPYVLGFAGYYDAYPWLSFAPFDHGLALGPLLYLYLGRLTTDALPHRWWLHLVPAAIAAGYMTWAFALPLAAKSAWNDAWHEPVLDPLLRWSATLSLATYWWCAVRYRRRYLALLAAQTSEREEHRLPWLGGILVALGVWLLLSAGVDVAVSAGASLNYYDRFPQYLAFSALVLWLGMEGWRHADHRFPRLSAPTEDPPPPGRDWHRQGLAWSAILADRGWWREPRLSLSEVARRLATNESYVSRAFNEGLGSNFNAVVNRCRVEAVQRRLLQGERDLLTLALSCGFASKASFNRVFREHAGASPTAWLQSQKTKSPGDPPFEATQDAERPTI